MSPIRVTVDNISSTSCSTLVGMPDSTVGTKSTISPATTTVEEARFRISGRSIQALGQPQIRTNASRSVVPADTTATFLASSLAWIARPIQATSVCGLHDPQYLIATLTICY